MHMCIPPSPNTHVQDVNALLKKVEFVIVPVVNPDGYLVSYVYVNLCQSSCMFASVGGLSQILFYSSCVC